jgi:hypothetical protein
MSIDNGAMKKLSSKNLVSISSTSDLSKVRIDLTTPHISQAMYNLGFNKDELKLLYIIR